FDLVRGRSGSPDEAGREGQAKRRFRVSLAGFLQARPKGLGDGCGVGRHRGGLLAFVRSGARGTVVRVRCGLDIDDVLSLVVSVRSSVPSQEGGGGRWPTRPRLTGVRMPTQGSASRPSTVVLRGAPPLLSRPSRP